MLGASSGRLYLCCAIRNLPIRNTQTHQAASNHFSTSKHACCLISSRAAFLAQSGLLLSQLKSPLVKKRRNCRRRSTVARSSSTNRGACKPPDTLGGFCWSTIQSCTSSLPFDTSCESHPIKLIRQYARITNRT